jgi:coenzyme F420-reducing hydrogenase alpha subunit
MNTNKKTKTIKVDYLARVEGEGSMYLQIRDDQLLDVQLKIFEPPRFFEGLLHGRQYSDAPDITARICGICPVAYQMSSVHALEQAFGVTVDGPLRELRRLLYCGEWISSHALHIFMLHAPDFLGYESSIHMAKDHRELVEKGLKLKQAGGAIMELLGGRAVHPINVRVGGFYKTPTSVELRAMVPQLEAARDIALETVQWAGQLDFPDFTQDYLFVALHHPEEYPMNEGHIVSNRGLDIPAAKFLDHFEEVHVERSNALHCVLKGQPDAYHVGPLARYALNYATLPASIQAVAKAAGLTEVCTNPFQSIVVRAVETLYACEEALRIIAAYERPEQPFVAYEPKASRGYAVTEAPRGILYHGYELDDKGDILQVDIIPPTSQNQRMIEDDLREFVSPRLNLPDEQLRWQAEQAIRNYDPCISCATHFLRLEVDRG